MIQPVVVAAVVTVIGGIFAITARDGRLVAMGILVAMVASQLTSSPEPTAPAIVFRVLGSMLAAYLLWAATRARSIASEGSGIGPLAEIAAAAAAFSVGWFVTPVEPLAGPVAAQAAGFALISVAIGPLTGRDVFRIGAGAALLVIGGSLLLEAWVGSGSSLGQIVVTALLVGIAGATGVLMSPIDTPAARCTSLALAEEEPLAPEVLTVGAAAIGPVSGDEPIPGAEIAAAAFDIAAAEAVAPERPKPARSKPAGPMAVRKTPRKTRKIAAEGLDGPEAPETPAKTRVRTTSVRVSPTRSVRGADQIEPEPALDDTVSPGEAEFEPDALPEALPRSGWIASRVRRLRPREPRR